MYLQHCNIEIHGEDAIVTGKSLLHQTPFEVICREKDLKAYIDGGLAQNCFPYLSRDDRELLISGVNSEEWTEMFGEEDENDG